MSILSRAHVNVVFTIGSASRYFSWQWQALVTATAVTSSLVHLFPYNNNSPALKIIALVVFLIALVIFIFNLVCIVLKAVLFPKVFIESTCKSSPDTHEHCLGLPPINHRPKSKFVYGLRSSRGSRFARWRTGEYLTTNMLCHIR